METIDRFIPLLLAVIASQGVWSLLLEVYKRRNSKQTGEQRLLRGIAHDRIWFLGGKYLRRGAITRSEYDNLGAIAEPYLENGGNGSGKKTWVAIKALPFISEEEAYQMDIKEVGK